MMDTAELARLKALAKNPGGVTEEYYAEWVNDAPDDGDEGPVACLATHGYDLRHTIREVVPALIAEVERLRAVLIQIADGDLPHERWCDTQSDCGHAKSAALAALGLQRQREDDTPDDPEDGADPDPGPRR